MIDVEYLEQKKAEIVANHIRRCHDANLSEAEQIIIAQLNWEIEQLNNMRGEQE